MNNTEKLGDHPRGLNLVRLLSAHNITLGDCQAWGHFGVQNSNVSPAQSYL